MDVHRTEDHAIFAEAVMPFLSQDPVRNTILLTVIDQLKVQRVPDAWFAWVSDAGQVVGAALRTPPYNVALSAMDPGVAAVIGAADDSPAAIGPRPVVEAFAHRREVSVYMHEKQYVLTELVIPPLTPGAARAYRSDDAELYTRWFRGFVAETGVPDRDDPVLALDRRLQTGGALWLWECDGEAVSMAGRSGPVCGVPRIGPVWTPPEHRGKGYAAAITAQVCAEAFSAGATACTLFTDAANATSNGVYRRLGFQLVGELVDARFGPSTAAVS